MKNRKRFPAEFIEKAISILQEYKEEQNKAKYLISALLAEKHKLSKHEINNMINWRRIIEHQSRMDKVNPNG